MTYRTSKESGFGYTLLLLILVIVLAIAGVGIYVYRQGSKEDRQTSSNKQNATNGKNERSDPYKGWKTATLSSPQLSFRYPADWTIVAAAGGKNIEVKSPASDGHYYSVSLISGKPSDVNLDFLGDAPGVKLTSFAVDDTTVYLDAQTAGKDGAVTGLGLATTDGAKASFGIIDPQNANNITMAASLLPVTPSGADLGIEYSLEMYKNHPEYDNVLKMFKSMTGNLPD